MKKDQEMNNEKLLEIANNLSNENICDLINIIAPRLDVFFGKLNRHSLSSGVDFACMNGATIQINCESAELEDLVENEFFKSAVESGDKNVQGES